MQAYSDPEREDDPHALPDVEIWQDLVAEVACKCGNYEVPWSSPSECPSCGKATKPRCTKRDEWWWWFCLPGCMPKGNGWPHGPFPTADAALADARDNAE